MPTYEYTCKGCGHSLELSQQMTEKPRKTCPKCKAPKLMRHIGGGGGIIFKGSGFYITDYKRAGEKKETAEGAGKPAGEKPAAESSEKPKSPKQKKDH